MRSRIAKISRFLKGTLLLDPVSLSCDKDLSLIFWGLEKSWSFVSGNPRYEPCTVKNRLFASLTCLSMPVVVFYLPLSLLITKGDSQNTFVRQLKELQWHFHDGCFVIPYRRVSADQSVDGKAWLNCLSDLYKDYPAWTYCCQVK